jgi:hypothetical protein
MFCSFSDYVISHRHYVTEMGEKTRGCGQSDWRPTFSCRWPFQHKSPLAKSPLAKSPLAKSPLAKSPLAKSPLAKSPLASSVPDHGTPSINRECTLRQSGSIL